MNSEQEAIVEQTVAFIKNQFSHEGSGHDWWHIYRVWQLALTLAQEESQSVDLFLLQMVALLHDLDDWKNTPNADALPKTRQWLSELSIPAEIAESICNNIAAISFRGAGEDKRPSTLEGQLVQDADRLDAIGAIGIARTFTYGGHKGRLIYDPDVKPESHQTFEAYKAGVGTTVNHFYEKLLLLKTLMNTTSGKAHAEKRHAFLENYLAQFFVEWEGGS